MWLKLVCGQLELLYTAGSGHSRLGPALGRPMNIFLSILGYTLRHKWSMVGAYACMAGATAAYLILPWLLGHSIDRVTDSLETGSHSDRAILVTTLAILGVAGIRGVLSFGQTFLGESLAQATVYDL